MEYKKLINKAKILRQRTFLKFIEKGEAHLGGSFSIIEILITLSFACGSPDRSIPSFFLNCLSKVHAF